MDIQCSQRPVVILTKAFGVEDFKAKKDGIYEAGIDVQKTSLVVEVMRVDMVFNRVA